MFFFLRKYIRCSNLAREDLKAIRKCLMLECLDHSPACSPHPCMQTAVFLCVHLMFASYIVLCWP